jgi:hypothetical protein
MTVVEALARKPVIEAAGFAAIAFAAVLFAAIFVCHRRFRFSLLFLLHIDNLFLRLNLLFAFPRIGLQQEENNQQRLQCVESESRLS